MSLFQSKNQNNVESTRGYDYVTPECDIYETESEYKMVYDLPGISKEDISIKIEKDILTVTADCKEKIEGYTLLGREFADNSYSRSFNLNNFINADNIQADFKNGLLVLTLPKREEQKTKEIKINIA